MENGSQIQLGKFTIEDIEKFKLFLSMIPEVEPKEVVSLRVLNSEYVNYIQSNRSASYLRSVSISNKHLTEFFGLQKPISSIQLKDVESFIIYLKQKVKKGYIVYFRNLKAEFNKAKEWGYIKENYFLKIRLPKRQKTAPAYIINSQLIEICNQLKNPAMKEIVIAAKNTGMRLSEITNLTKQNVNLTTRIITVGDENFTTKSRNQRYIPMSLEVYEILLNKITKKQKDSKSNADYVFCKSDGKKFTEDYVSKKFKQACKAAGIEKSIHFHSLRHSFASNLAQKGISLYIIKELLGHASISTTEIYSHLNIDSLKDAINIVEVTSLVCASEPYFNDSATENKIINSTPEKLEK